MWIKPKRDTVADRKQIAAGVAVEVSDKAGRYLVGTGWADPAEQPAPKKKISKKPASE